MSCYRIHGLTVRLPITVEGFSPAPDNEVPDLDVAWTDEPEPDVADGHWKPVSLNQNQKNFPIYRAWLGGDGSYLWYLAGTQRAVKYRMHSNLSRIDIWRHPELSPLTLVRPAFTQALAFLLRARKRLLLHAASVTIAERATLIVGAMGQGKSTLVYSLIREGCGLLSDDMSLPDLSGPGALLHAGQSMIKLLPNSIATLAADQEENWPMAVGGIKREVFVPAVDAARAYAIERIILLEPRGNTDSLRLESVPPGEAVVALTQHVHPRYLPVGQLDQAEMRLVFRELGELVRRVPVLRLYRPDALDSVTATSRKLIEAALN